MSIPPLRVWLLLVGLGVVVNVQANENNTVEEATAPALSVPSTEPVASPVLAEPGDVVTNLETVPLQESQLAVVEQLPEQAWLQRLRQGLLRPQYQHMTQLIQSLDEKAQAFCAAPDENWLEQVREQWLATISRWASLSVAAPTPEWAQVSPQLWTPLAARALDRYWDKRETLSPAMVSQWSPGEKGLAALEGLLFAPRRPVSEQLRLFADPQRCVALVAITGALLLDTAPLLKHLDTDVVSIPVDSNAANVEVLRQWQYTLTALRQWRQQFLLTPLQQRQEDRVSTPFDRSNATLAVLDAALDGFGTLWLGNGQVEGLRAWLVLQHPGLAQTISQQYDEVRASAQALNPSLEESLLQQPRKVQRLITELKRLESLVGMPLLQALGLKPVL